MLTKNEFLNFMCNIKETCEKSDKISEFFYDMGGGDIILYDNELNVEIGLLCKLMDIEYNNNDYYGDDIQYFIFELNWGKNTTLNSPYKNEEELYDYIVELNKLTPKQRVQDELKDLRVKIDKLDKFINSDDFHNLDELSGKLLNHQLTVMNEYAITLELRLKNWRDK